MKYINIKNPTRYYSQGVTRCRLRVPDFNCKAARKQRQKDWELRITEEIRRYVDAGGLVVFTTLTYSDDNLPKFHFIDPDTREVQDIPCFNKVHKDKFLKGIADDLRYYYHYSNKKRDDSELPFRYVWAPEFGNPGRYIDDHGNWRESTERPHYHPLLFFPPSVSELFQKISDVKILIERHWPYGMVRWSQDEFGHDNLFVTEEYAGTYTSKYCTKDLDFFENSKITAFLYPNGKFDQDGKQMKMDSNRYMMIKEYLPKFQTSQHIGESLKYRYQTVEDFRDGVDFHLASEVQKGKSVKHRPPLYIQRKTLLKYDYKEGRYKHTELGKKYKLQILMDKLAERSKNFEKSITPIEISKLLSSDEIRREFADINCSNSVELAHFITSILIDRPASRYILYQTVWRGREIPSYSDPQREQCYLDSLSQIDFLKDSLELYSLQLDNDTFDCFVEEGYFNILNVPPISWTYDKLPYFVGFNKIEEILGRIYDVYIERCNRIYHEDRLKRKKFILSA